MGMPVDETWQNRRPAEVDHLSPRWNLNAVSRTNF
jgi:hypothetical protein